MLGFTYDPKGYQYFVRVSIQAKERKVTNFGRADDRKSRCVTELLRVYQSWEMSPMYDHEFDAGEFSAPACAEAMYHEMNAVCQKYGWDTIDVFVEELRDVVSDKFIHFELGFIGG